MPTLLFANLETLQLALASGVVPAAVRRAPVLAGTDAEGRIWLQPQVPLSPQTATTLACLGVTSLDRQADVALAPATCWLQLLPLLADPWAPAPEVLFDVLPAELPRLTAEIRRLAPAARLSFCHWDFFSDELTVSVRATQPPVFSLLRSVAGGTAIAYIEQAPRVWVEFGYRHPLAEQIEPPARQCVFLRSPNLWTFRAEAPFVEEPPTFALTPAGRVPAQAQDVRALEMPLLLVPSLGHHAAALWVVRERPLEQLTQLVLESDFAVLTRFRVALLDSSDGPLLILWAVPSRRPPPVLMLTGVPCRPLSKLAKIFLPTGRRLQPTPRRDTLRRLFAIDDQHITILLSSASESFATVRVPESAFLPLDGILEYSAGSADAPWEAILPQPGLEWREFVEVNEAHAAARRASALDPAPRTEDPLAAFRPARAAPAGILTRFKQWLRPPPLAPLGPDIESAVRTALPDALLTAALEPAGRRHDLQERRALLEQRFMHALGLSGTAERLAVLPELASIHAQLGNFSDAAVCWLNAAWDHESPPSYWLWGWLQVEKKLSTSLYTEAELVQFLDLPPSPAMIRTLAASVVWLSRQDTPPADLTTHASRIRLLLEAHEHWLPVRAAWLAQLGLSRGDVLAMARTRDRLLERFRQRGLSLELDVPSFLRFEGRGTSERFTFVRDWLLRLRAPIQRWAEQLVRQRPTDYCRALPPRFPDQDGRNTKALMDLMLAWGLARLGEHNAARHLEQAGRELLERFDDPVSRLLAEAYAYRIDQARESKLHTGPLPPKLLAALEQLAADPEDDERLLTRYRIDVLRGRSRILEPSERISPVRPIAVRLTADPPDPEPPPLWTADELSGLVALLTAASPHMDQVTHALALEQALTTAANLGDVDVARALIPLLARLFSPGPPRFGNLAQQLLQPPFGEGYRPEELHRLESSPAQCLRALHQLGLSAEAERFRVPAVEWILHGDKLINLRKTQALTWLSALRALLHLAGDWFGEPDEELAVTVLEAARKSLLHVPDIAPMERLSLACAYATALAQAPVNMVRGRIEELFRDLSGFHDTRQTNSHFALSPLVLVDAVVRAIVHEDFSLAPAARRWLDEDELRVRQRMQHDLKNLAEPV